jgi:Ca2+-binding RTX toxin-like protein
MREFLVGTFSFGALPSVDTSGIDFSEIINSPVVTSTSTRLVLNAGEVFLRAEGSGFVYSRQGGQIVDVTAGTLDRLVASSTASGGVIGFDWTNLNLSMATLSDSLFAGNAVAFRSYLFSRADRVIGTAGNDELFSYSGDDTVLGNDGADVLSGAGGNDDLFGGKGEDRVYGGSGRDSLVGRSADDALYGGADGDTLAGGTGRDELTGGGGKDAFVFDTAIGSTQRDYITDFVAVDDRMRLDNAIFTRIGPVGVLEADRFVVGVAARESIDRIIYDRAEGVLSYDPDGTGAAAAIIFATVTPGVTLTHWDIVVF